MNILITGATGNVGIELINQLLVSPNHGHIIAGVRDINKAKKNNPIFSSIESRVFDFEDCDTFDTALVNIDIIFLLRPPHISNIDKYFRPLILKIAKSKNIKIIFLSVQGAEKSTIIPHRKIELLIINNKIEYIFLRPSYFMQNLTTTLYPEISNDKSITLPSGNAKFNWIDIIDIARIGVECINNFNQYINCALTISGLKNLNFSEVVNVINGIAHSKIKYLNVNPVRYFIKKKKEKMEIGMIIVMLILHFLPKIQSEPDISNTYQIIFKEDPHTIEDFVKNNSEKFT